MKNKTQHSKIPFSLAGLSLLFSTFFLSGCIALPFVTYEPSKQNRPTENSKYSFTPSLVIPPSSPLYVSHKAAQKTPDVTSEEQHKSDINRTFHPIIWQEMQHQFNLSIDHLGKYDQHIDSFRKKPNYLKVVTQNAKPYLHYILTQIQLRDMPYEIALLPIIESGFKPTARSNKEAGGLWQFIPSTGRLYGLEQNWWYDGRQDVIKSTQAALDYLQSLYRINNNDWLLALASYNAGPGNVRRAIRKYHKKQPQQKAQPNYWDIQPYLPKETQNYVPQLLAVSHVINHSDLFNIELEPIDNVPFFAAVPLPKQIHLKKAIQLSQVSETTFNQLNAGYLSQITPPNGEYHILLPLDKVDSFQQLIASNKALFNIQWQKHKIKRGESLGLIAQHYKTSQKEIKKLNNLKSHRIRAGKTLLIPIPNRAETTKTTLLAKTTTKQKKKVTTKKTHKVRSGDSLWRIARAYNTNVKSIRRWNNLSPSMPLKPGMKLTIWQNKPTSKTAAFARYKIQSGDSLWKIARKNSISTSTLAKYNKLSIKAYLKPGQLLKIPI
ncbi:Membrane-bound lytic murein transglycosylase D [hydrothermal vent metagenome]|uniref:Membrane-bound lytic murein transglycosylase D n=1 Tax=hydrothermal vent metagenome TaxID=652676 RepID=A0A3B0WT68_9ZZZZ